MIVLLPGLVAGSGIAAPPTAGELARLQSALSGPGAHAGSEVARTFLLSWIGPSVVQLPDTPELRAAVVSRARLAQISSVMAIGFLLYVVLLLARGRVQALLGCVLLATLPPVALEGHELRPETAAVLMTLLGVLLLQCLAQSARRWRARGSSRFVSQAGLCTCATLALALAVAAMPASGQCLLVPGVVLTLAAIQLAARALRIGRRRGLGRVPVRSINRRLLPWTAGALLAPVMTILVLTAVLPEAAEAVRSASEVALLPASWVPRIACWLLLAVGALAAIVRVGLRFGRRGRIDVDVVLLVFCAIHLAASLGAGAFDRLPAAPAMAIVLSEGARLLIGLFGFRSAGLGGRAPA